MGRYYNGMIDGKFWFGVQSSDDGTFFGAMEQEPSVIEYFTDDLEQAEEGIKQCKQKLGKHLKKLNNFFEDSGGYNDDMLAEYLEVPKSKVSELLRWYARLELGLRIADCIEKEGYCSFEAEY